MAKNKQIYFIRHGETHWNLIKKFQGHTDIPLNDSGKKQAESLIALLKEIDPDHVLSSDLSRAFETAQIACQNISVAMTVHEELRETNLGEAEGMLREDLLIKHGEKSLEKWFSVAIEDCDFSFTGGETKVECVRRVKGFLESWIDEQGHHEKIVIFSHGGVIRNVVHSSEGQPESPVLIQNCICHLLEYEPHRKVWRYVKQVN